MKSVLSTPTRKECESLVVQTHLEILRRVSNEYKIALKCKAYTTTELETPYLERQFMK